MDGKTFRIASGEYTQLVVLDNQHCLLVRADSGPHRYCAGGIGEAKGVAQWIGEPKGWAQSNPGKSDDGWDNVVSFKGEALAQILARSEHLYGEAARVREADAAARVAESVAADRANAARSATSG